ncbi:amidase [soil metagenome]
MANEKNRVHAFTDDVLADLDGVAIAGLVKNKEVTSSEVVAASIARAKKVDPKLKAVVTDLYDSGLAAASKPLGKGFFAGVPTFFKDLTLVKGVKTYYGSEAFAKTRAATKTDAIAKQILAQGFINLGTSSMPEFGFTCSTEFPHLSDTRNPWNIDHSTGGSSGGAAALVAAGVVPIAHSADGGGSTRIPAACCGLVGLKASRGRLLRSSIFNTQLVDIAIDGVITRSVRDTAYFYAEAEKYHHNPRLPAIGLVEGPSNRKYKIGYLGGTSPSKQADAATLEVLQNTVALLESMGHQVKPIVIPGAEQFAEDFVNLWSMSAFYVRHFGGLMFGSNFDGKKLTKLTHGLSKHHFNNILKTPFFVYRLRQSYHTFSKLLAEQNIDFLLTPTLAHAAPKIGYLGMNLEFEEMFPRMADWAIFSPYANATGGPSISLPLGHDDYKDLPIGMMLCGNHGEEKLLLDISYQLEAAQPWRRIV